MKKILLSFLLLFGSVLTLWSQKKLPEKIETKDGSIYIGEVVTETEDMVKIIIDKKSVVNIDKSTITFRGLETVKERNHIIYSELTNQYMFGLGLSYDYNFYRTENWLFGGTAGVGLVGAKAGGYAARRLNWQDLLKVEAGLSSSSFFLYSLTVVKGPYMEFGYRFQSDRRWFSWELSVGNIFDFDKTPLIVPYLITGIGVTF